jgi:hypothetical protein
MVVAANLENYQIDTSAPTLGRLLYQMLRKVSYPYEEDRVNRDKELRARLIETAKKEARDLIPEATEEEWKSGIQYLANQMARHDHTY